jgi:nucleotide-binding universal stress UspA family protein
MKKILVPSDFSGPSTEAFKAAVDLASKAGGSVILLHVINIPAVADSGFDAGVGYSPELIDLWQEDAEKSIQSMINDLPKDGPPVVGSVAIGMVLPVILDVIKREGIDLVVMGKTGRTGLPHVLIGSTTEKLVRHSPAPVLSVVEAKSLSSVNNIVLPSTLALDQIHFMEKVKELQEFFRATIHILHVNTPYHFQRDSDAYAGMQDVIRNYHLTRCQTHFVNNYSEEAGITEFATERKMDLIVMGTHARKGLAQLFNHSISEELANSYPGAVWTCPLKKPKVVAQQ